MREIKFRGYNGEKWLFGNLDIDYKAKQACISDNGFWRRPVRFETVGQFTGLKDSNGKEIYEGDIVVVKEDGEESRHVVRYMDDEDYPAFDLVPESMKWCYESNGLSYCMINMETAIYVIGNIHDTPELLEVEA